MLSRLNNILLESLLSHALESHFVFGGERGPTNLCMSTKVILMGHMGMAIQLSIPPHLSLAYSPVHTMIIPYTNYNASRLIHIFLYHDII